MQLQQPPLIAKELITEKKTFLMSLSGGNIKGSPGGPTTDTYEEDCYTTATLLLH